MSEKVLRDRARGRRALGLGRRRHARERRRVITFITDGRGRVRAFVCSRGHRHADFLHALACEGDK